MYLKIPFTVILLMAMFHHLAAATTHKHVHQTIYKERTEDGAYVARDAHHYDDDDIHHNEFDHEAILGSVKEAEEFDNLSPEESQKRLAILVQKMDLNADGFIEPLELKVWILRSFKSLSEEEAAERFDEIDSNKDDKITWKEFLLETYGMENEDGMKENILDGHSEEEKKMIADDKELWAAADKDKNGYLVLDEFFRIVTPEEYPEMVSVIIKQSLKEKDLNGDGKIDFQEFVADDANDQDKEWLLAEKDKFDEDYDKNGDGFLNNNEIINWLYPNNHDIAQTETDHLFASSDDDHDRRLSYKEIIDHYDIFVGSEVTDYGDHLHNIHHFDDEL